MPHDAPAFYYMHESLFRLAFSITQVSLNFHEIPLRWVPSGSPMASHHMKITKQQIDAASAKGQEGFLWDGSIKGFGLRIRPSGAKTFIYSYRAVGGRSASKKRITIGVYGNITLEQARKQAQQLAGHVAGGGDPASDRNAKRREAERTTQTVAKVSADFIEKYAKPNNRSWREYERILSYNVLPRIGTVPVHELRRRDVIGILDHVAENSGAPMADHVLAVVRKMLNWHAARDDEFISPIVKGMARTRPSELARARVLDDEEIRRIWHALDAIDYPYSPLVRLLFLTAQRRQEIAQARWSEIDTATGTWVIPAERYKTKRANVVPLPEAALEIIARIPRQGEFLFSAREAGFSGFSKAKKRLDKLSDTTNWRLHDIRRSSRTLMVRCGVRPDIAERVLGHVIPGVAGVYDRYDYVREKKEALDCLAQQLDLIVRGASSSNLVLLRSNAA